jgi:hypothetical protein
MTTHEVHSDQQAETSDAGIERQAPEDGANVEAVVADDDLSGLRARWDEIQAAFVDDPKECVQKADALVTETVRMLTAGFEDARSRLEAQWARGEEASTEGLRLALTRYREFFQRLLSV